jgi:hypothetical protein
MGAEGSHQVGPEDAHQQVGLLASRIFGSFGKTTFSTLSGAKRKSEFEAVRAAFDPERT